MCCSTGRGKHGHGHHHGGHGKGHHHFCSCGCQGPQHFQRRFMTQKEQIDRLDAYLKDLQGETKAVQEQIDQLKQKK